MIRKIRWFFYELFLIVRAFWYFKVLGRKRDMDKDHDCEYYEHTTFKEPCGDCEGDGHYMCKQCRNYDFEENKQIEV